MIEIEEELIFEDVMQVLFGYKNIDYKQNRISGKYKVFGDVWRNLLKLYSEWNINGETLFLEEFIPLIKKEYYRIVRGLK